MRIVHVIPDLGMGGAERMCSELAQFQTMANEVHIVVIGEATGSRNESIADVQIHYLGKGVGFEPAMIARASSLVTRLRPDVVHTHRHVLKYLLPAVVALGTKACFVHTLHNTPMREAGNWDRILQRGLFRSGRVTPVALSEELSAASARYYGMEVTHVGNGVPVESYVSREPPNIDRPTIVWVGRMVEQKDPLTFVEAMRALNEKFPKSRAIMYGEGPLRSSVESAVRDARGFGPDTTVVRGASEDARRLIADADLLVMTSLWEGMPLVALEAMGAGTPVVAPGVGGLEAIAQEGGCVTFPPSDATACAARCLDLLVDPALWASQSRRGHRLALARYSLSQMAHSYLAVYSRAAASRGRVH